MKEESGYCHHGSAAVLRVELKQKNQETARRAEKEKKAKRDVELTASNPNGKLKLIDFLKLGNSSETSLSVTDIQQAAKVDRGRRIFSCNFCQRKFLSSQALGGHQNGHRRERSLRKTGQVYGYLHHNCNHHYCSGISSCPRNHPYGAYSMNDCLLFNTRGSIYRQPCMRLVSNENYHLGNLARPTPPISHNLDKAAFNLKRGVVVSPSDQHEILTYPVAIGGGRSKNHKQYDEQILDLSLKL